MKKEATGTDAGGEHVGPLLDAYRTDELDVSARAAVEAHLESCDGCREELAALGPWTAAIERGYAALREEGRELEPDWAAQRAAVVAQTSGRRSGSREGWSFRRWAPQVALVAVAVLIVGVVWRERAGGPGGEPVLSTSERQSGGQEERAAAAPEEQAAAPGRSDEDASGFARKEPRAAAGRDAPADAAPPAVPSVAARAAPEERGRAQEVAEADEPVLAEGVPLAKVAEADAQRFADDARAALGARDTAAARRALALWSDTLTAAEADNIAADDTLAALADSLRELLAPE